MISVLKTLAEIAIGLAIAGMVLAVLLPLLIKAGYLTLGSDAGIWIIGLVIAVSVLLTLFKPRRSSRDTDSKFDE